jgi:hypothetical protein
VNPTAKQPNFAVAGLSRQRYQGAVAIDNEHSTKNFILDILRNFRSVFA